MSAPRTPLADLPLAELRLALAPAIADAAAFDGWSAAAVRAAATAQGVPPELAELAFAKGAQGSAAMTMIAAWVGHVDAAMCAEFAPAALAQMPVRSRIATLVSFRLQAARGREEALARALAVMAMPGHLARAARLGWASADAMWRLAGDTATDYNHYTKRATLAALYAATLAVFVQDTSDGKAETLAFLDRRIDGVMRFEKAKARLLPGAAGKAQGADGIAPGHFSLLRLAGRLRYPAP